MRAEEVTPLLSHLTRRCVDALVVDVLGWQFEVLHILCAIMKGGWVGMEGLVCKVLQKLCSRVVLEVL